MKKTGLKCKDVMTGNPVFCVPEETVEHAARLMRDHDIGSIPVVQSRENRTLVGIVTDRDLTIKVLADARDPRSARAEEMMSRDPVSCREEDSVEKAMRAMADHQVRRIPIVDARTRLVGIIAQADVATRLGDEESTGEVVEEISK
jgi:CBS domain-containing protein